ncbi:12722_t:CDS:2 [Funneliformis caledonium]|uniref:12722_t:CDS:1 n=1 Tax=Funneliformis caledonium TaxID=1117310 RepID=A0A9N9CEG8_9GLOM|nr:12722_t:CDS:2 [Funneliformis caledonium]
MDKDEFLPKLTQNFLEILDDDEYYDITIEIEIITKWIEKLEITDEITASYEFKLLSRFQDGDTIRYLREFPTITVIKVKGTNEILGGYNNPNAKGTIATIVGNAFFQSRKTKDSFVFSFKDNDINNHILSRIKNEEFSICNCLRFGYSDLKILSSFYGRCEMSDYEKPIRDTVDGFEIEICEIFLITKINAEE